MFGRWSLGMHVRSGIIAMIEDEKTNEEIIERYGVHKSTLIKIRKEVRDGKAPSKDSTRSRDDSV